MTGFEAQRDFCQFLAGEAEPPPGIDADRAGVHRDTFVGTLVQALAESFPVTRALAGSEFFDAMARERVLAEPPRSPVLAEYAQSLPAFMVGFAPASAAPVLAEMAQLEALRLCAFDAEDAEPAGMAEFSRLACDASLFARTAVQLHPAARWLPARHALLELWHAHEAAGDIGAVDLSGIDAGRGQDVLVHRPRFALQMRLLPAGAIALLDALASGCALSAAFAEAADEAPAVQPATLFSLLLREGLVTRFIELPGGVP